MVQMYESHIFAQAASSPHAQQQAYGEQLQRVLQLAKAGALLPGVARVVRCLV
jgi:hypothetical protein